MKNKKITFIGGGNMAASLISGLLDNGFASEDLHVADIDSNASACQFPVRVYTDNQQAITGTDVVVLAVKPQILPKVCQQLQSYLQSQKVENLPVFISIAAGVRLAELSNWLGVEQLPLIRVMPNTPALVQSGASALFANDKTNANQRDIAENILRSVGLTVWLQQESLLDTVTAISGSGPAYFFRIMEIMTKVGTDLGLPADISRLLTLQTAFGAAKMAIESKEEVGILRQRVTSKGGTTEQALNVFNQQGLSDIFTKALTAAHDRSIELATELAQQHNQTPVDKRLNKNKS